MIWNQRATVALTFFAVITLMSTVAFGALADYSTQAFTDGDGKLWSGTTDFPVPPVVGSPLYGHIDWAVFAPGAFPFSGGGYTPTSGEFTYVYQIFGDGPAAVSLLAVALENPADNIGSFSFGDITGAAPTANGISPYESAEWDFAGFANGAGSRGLAFSSPYGPEDLYSIVIDHGQVAVAQPIPSPGTYSIPEPSTLVLLLMGLAMGGAAVVKRRAA